MMLFDDENWHRHLCVTEMTNIDFLEINWSYQRKHLGSKVAHESLHIVTLRVVTSYFRSAANLLNVSISRYVHIDIFL